MTPPHLPLKPPRPKAGASLPTDKKNKLAKALRDNLRRRKTALSSGKQD